MSLALTVPLPAVAQIVPSPDGRFDECIIRTELVAVSRVMGLHLAVKWYRRSGTTEEDYQYSREALSFFISEPSQRDFVIWKGWYADDSMRGRDPELMCVQAQGAQSIVLRDGLELPSAPFGIVFPDNDGWRVNPYTPSPQGRGTAYSMCVAADEILRSRGATSAGCDEYDYRGYIRLMEDNGYKLTALLRMSTNAFLMLFGNGDIGMMATVGSRGLIVETFRLYEYEEATAFLSGIHQAETD
ncbi:MAG: hypothetical protein EON58_18650 [Alphaproteobacteria bacterium]|nr:MAG: hypothetical protein EON58_18650 [Alphaproteobacteria bacterium]